MRNKIDVLSLSFVGALISFVTLFWWVAATVPNLLWWLPLQRPYNSISIVSDVLLLDRILPCCSLWGLHVLTIKCLHTRRVCSPTLPLIASHIQR